MQELYFISGLPRAGTTLLASILRQNPKFWSHVESPTGQIFVDMVSSMSAQRNEAHWFLRDEQRLALLRSIFESYYEHTAQTVVFDNNRKWCANLDTLGKAFPDAKVLVCVRNPAAIIDSFEKTVRSNPGIVSIIHGDRANLTVYDRLNNYMAPDGVVGWALKALRDAYFGPQRDKLVIVRYDDLARFPNDVMRGIHDALGEAPFDYDFEHIDQLPDIDTFDRSLGMPGLHRLNPKVAYDPRPSILPPDVIRSLPVAFWDVKEKDTKDS